MASRKFAKDLNAEILQQHAIVSDAEIANVRTELAAVKSKYKSALVLLDRERQRADSIASLQNITGDNDCNVAELFTTGRLAYDLIMYFGEAFAPQGPIVTGECFGLNFLVKLLSIPVLLFPGLPHICICMVVPVFPPFHATCVCVCTSPRG